jgi:hypothetical protein
LRDFNANHDIIASVNGVAPNGANILTVLKFHDNELASVTVLSISMVLGTVEDML